MPSQEEMNKGMLNLLMIATDLLKETEHPDIKFEVAQNLIRQCFFKYLDLADCPFRDACREDLEAEEGEPEPIDVRGELD